MSTEGVRGSGGGGRNAGGDGSSRCAIWLPLAVLVALTALAVLIGRFPEFGITRPSVLASDPLAVQLVLNLRLPRIVAALVLGAVLGTAGLVLQTIFSNPLVEPGLVGVSQGAAFGAALVIVLAGPTLWLTQGAAAVGGFLGLFLSYAVARRIRFGGWVLRLILAGIAVSALFSAGIGLIKYTADPLDQLPAITFWMLGGLWHADWTQVVPTTLVAVPALIVMLAYRWRLNLLALDDRVGFSLGVATGRERILMMVVATFGTAVVVSLSGIVAWIGLVVPNLARRRCGADTQKALPLAAVMGAGITLLCDTVARTIRPGEVPLGTVTAAVGSILFIYVMTRTRLTVQR